MESVNGRNSLVSVVVLSYNHESFIERTLQSVINQNFSDFEIIYIDNNSFDNAFEKGLNILQASNKKFYAEKTKQNLGISNGINYGISFAKGQYISTLAGDDWWDMDNLKYKTAHMLKNPEYGMVYGNGYKYNNTTQEIDIFYKSPFMSGFIFKDLLKGPVINSQGILYDHALIKSLGYFDSSAKIEDRDLWLRIAKIAPVGYVHEALSFYRVNHGQNISNDLKYMHEGNEFIFKKYEKDFPVEIKIARSRQHDYFAYSLATRKPSFYSLIYILKNYQFGWVYNKQVIKCIINMLKKLTGNIQRSINCFNNPGLI